MPKFEDKGRLIRNERQAEYEIDPIFIGRWSPRAFDPTSIDDNIIRSLFEAARWAPSCFNDQPWLILYATDSDELELFRGLLSEGNRLWCASAPVLGFLFARRRFKHNDKPNRWAVFDCGSAWMSMAMQARMMGLYTHAMAGFNQEEIYSVLGIPDSHYQAICAFAVGQYGNPESLSEKHRNREKPNDRVPLNEFVFKGRFK